MKNCRKSLHIYDETLHKECPECSALRNKQWRQNNPEREKRRHQLYRDAHREEFNQTRIKWRADNPEHDIWYAMKQRCYNPNTDGYQYYGGKGIRVCERWLESFDNFFQDMGARPSAKHTIERLDNDVDYGPKNCRWATQTEQSRNTSRNVFVEYQGERKCLSAWAEHFGINKGTLYGRLRRGASFEEAIKTTNNAKEPNCQMDEMK
jgi:hypothetical protein